MKAYDLLFGTDAEHLAESPGRPGTLSVPDAVPAGWTGARAPGIRTDQWPLSPTTGLPMMHAITLWLPPEYRRRGPDLVGISFWAGEGQFAANWTWEPLYPTINPHPQLQIMTDIIDGKFALLWHTEAELTGPPADPPPDIRSADQREVDDEGSNAWSNPAPGGADPAPVAVHKVWSTPRDWDVNAGIAPVEWYSDASKSPDNHYQDWYHGPEEFTRVAREFATRTHLGGTCFPVQSLPEGLTPYYLELQEISGLNFGGGGVAQIDLESGVFDWACG